MEIGSWKIEGIFKADANIVAQEIQSISLNRTDEEFKPQDMVDYAKNPTTELHKCFEWNDEIAADKYRISQAQDVLRNIVIVASKEDNQQEKTPIRMFVSTNNRDNSYKPVTVVMQNKDEYQRLLQQAYADLQTFKQRYQHLKELAKFIALIP